MIAEPYDRTMRWKLRDFDTDEESVFVGPLLGAATSHRRRHNHDENRWPTTPCHACRWFEVRIIRDDATNEYVVSFQGFTQIPGERHRHTVHRTSSPYSVIEILTQQRDGETRIPRTSRMALSEAAGRDVGIEEAWNAHVMS